MIKRIIINNRKRVEKWMQTEGACISSKFNVNLTQANVPKRPLNF